MNTLPEFQTFLAELQTLINKYNASDPKLLTKDQRIAFAARQTIPLYRKQFALITDYIANALQLDPGHIDQTKARTRTARIAWARQLCMTFAHELTDAPHGAIAGYYGCPSHGNVTHARRAVENACLAYASEKNFLDRTRLEIKECLQTAAAMLKAKEALPVQRLDPLTLGPKPRRIPSRPLRPSSEVRA